MGLRIVQSEQCSEKEGDSGFLVHSDRVIAVMPGLNFVRMYGITNSDELLEAMLSFRSTLEVCIGWTEDKRRRETRNLLAQLRGSTSDKVSALVERVLQEEELPEE